MSFNFALSPLKSDFNFENQKSKMGEQRPTTFNSILIKKYLGLAKKYVHVHMNAAHGRFEVKESI